MKDLPSIVEIENTSFKEDPYPEHLFEQLLVSQNTIFLVAEDPTKVVAYCILKLEQSGLYRSKKKAILVSIAVSPGSRRKGVGRMILSGAISKATETWPNLRLIELQVSVTNEPAISFYARIGFVESGLIKNYYGKNKDGLSMKYSFEQ